MSDTIGPSLPPQLQKKKENVQDSDTDKQTIGPALPPWLRKAENSNKSDAIGPNLPPENDVDVKKPQENQEDRCSVGPALPSWMKQKDDEEGKNDKEEDDEGAFGPSLPPQLKVRLSIGPSLPDSSYRAEVSEDDEPIIGPLPPSESESTRSNVAEEFEKRAKKMKDRLTGNEEPKKLEREEWMTELPPLLQGFGGGPRKFRAHERDIGDRSVWTETPADRARKANQGKEGKSVSDEDRIQMEVWAKRDEEISQRLSDAPERKESLMKMHEKERKRKAEEEKASGEAKIRRPFDRELDLQVNKFDEAAKKRMMKQGQGLSSRFSAGTKTSKFL